MGEKETLKALGRLIAAAHKDKYPSRRQFAAAADIDVKTITSAEKGERELHPTSMRRIERALGWRKGSIEEIWEHRDEIDPARLTVAEMERGGEDAAWSAPVGEEPHANRASQLTDEELLAELAYRFRNYKVRLNGES